MLAITLLIVPVFCRRVHLTHQVTVSTRDGTSDQQQGRGIRDTYRGLSFHLCPGRNQRIALKKEFFREKTSSSLMVIWIRKGWGRVGHFYLSVKIRKRKSGELGIRIKTDWLCSLSRALLCLEVKHRARTWIAWEMLSWVNREAGCGISHWSVEWPYTAHPTSVWLNFFIFK